MAIMAIKKVVHQAKNYPSYASGGPPRDGTYGRGPLSGEAPGVCTQGGEGGFLSDRSPGPTGPQGPPSPQ